MANGGTTDIFGGESFSMRRPSLLEQLKNILREYPKDFQILHELVQNAEDAGASVLKIKYNHGKRKPQTSEFSKFFESPALCVYNDSVFDHEDWLGIISVCLSHKEQKTNKIGRYGQGFKSVFHLTDYPVIISGKYVLMIDPFKLDNECTRKTISKMMTHMANTGMFEMFDLHDVDIFNTLQGTLFWFPLRTRPSQLSETTWDSIKINDILKSYEREASLVLIFLKSLAKIEISHSWGSIVVESTMTIKDRTSIAALFGGSEENETITHDRCYYTKFGIQSGSRQLKLAILHFYAGTEKMTEDLERLVEDKEIGCLPYVGIAFDYGETRSGGRIFNFLPLPTTNCSGLPVHLNGYFALSQNRRTLKLAGYGKSSDKFVRWNELLVKEVATKGYTKLIKYLIEDSKKNNNLESFVRTVYASLPQNEQRDLPLWSTLVQSIYSQIIKSSIFFIRISGGKWVGKDSAMLFRLTKFGYGPYEGCAVEKTVKKLLLALGQDLFEEKVNTELLTDKSNIKLLNTGDVAKFIRQSRSPVLTMLSKKEKIAILRYFIAEECTNYDDLQLLPLANGVFEKFCKSRKTIYIVRKYEDIKLFPGKEHCFAEFDLPYDVIQGLNSMGRNGKYQLRHLQRNDVPLLLKAVVDTYLYNDKEVGRYIQRPNSPLNITWMKLLWKYIHQNYEDDYTIFDELPLIPQYRHGNDKIDTFYVLKGRNILSSCEVFKIPKLPEKVLDILRAYGVTVLNCNEIITTYSIILKYVSLPALDNIKKFCENNQEMRQKIQQCVGLGQNIWLPEGTSAMSFGQHEKLITRLKGILSNYPINESLLKEMIQNADDAGASEIHFLLDMRTHKTEQTFFESWHPLQGPALSVYNDGIFTDTDLEGLKELGEGSKIDDRTKTGQFGIGFNSVYHITDAPCLLALGPNSAMDGLFCVFDPHCRYAPLAHYGNPGMIMKSNELENKHLDVFETFLSTKELKRDKGTWFRFPLRRSCHLKSKISSKTFEVDDVYSLLKRMKENIHENLLFLLNLKKISISFVDQHDKHIQLCETEVVSNNETAKKQKAFKVRLCQMNKILRNSTPYVLNESLEEYAYTFSIKIDNMKTTEWLVIQSLGLTEPTSVDSDIQRAFRNKDIRFLPRGGVAVLLNGDLDHSKAFCILPLPIETGIPCHINGLFAIDSSRQKLWGSDRNSNINDIKGKWNMELLKKNIAYAYATAVSLLRNGPNGIRINKLFPIFNQATNTLIRYLIFHIYFQIKKRNLKVFQLASGKDNLESWVSWIPNEGMRGNPLLIDDLLAQEPIRHTEYRRIFLTMGMHLVHLPLNIQKSINRACRTFNTHEQTSSNCICIRSIDPTSAIDFFVSLNRRCLQKLKGRTEDIKLCVTYCFKVEDVRKVEGLPLLLRNDGTFIDFKQQNTLILSEFSDLLPTCADHFVHSDLTDLCELRSLKFSTLTGRVFKQLLPKLISESHNNKNGLILLRQDDTALIVPWLKRLWQFIDDTEDAFDELAEWYLLPITFGDLIYLSPIKNSKFCIDYESFDGGVHLGVTKIMRKLCLPEPVVYSAKLLKSLAKYENVSGVIDCIYYYRNIFKNMNILTEDESVLFFEYIMTTKCFNEKTIGKLKEIPLFVSINGQNVNIANTDYFAVYDTRHAPIHSLERLFGELCVSVLKYFPGIHNLYDIINCKIIRIADVYSQYVLPNFKLVDEQLHMEHMRYLKDNLTSDFDVECALREVSFLPSGNTLKEAKYFYNPDHHLFAEFSVDINFPPAPYRDKSWRSFLIRAGLKHDVDEDTFIDLAKKVARPSVKSRSEKTCQSSLLLEYLDRYIRTNGKNNNDFIQDISTIKFIPVHPLDDSLKDICVSNVNCNIMSSLGESFSYEQRYLVWTVAQILPPCASECKSQMNLCKTPEFDVVKLHIKNICTALQRSWINHDQSMIELIMTRIYEYLRDHNLRLKELIGIPLFHIPDHRLFAYPQQVVRYLDIKDEIIPYMLRAPDKYGAFFDLFDTMGMQIEPTASTFGKILGHLRQDCSETILSPSELELSRKALYGFMKSLRYAKEPIEDLGVETLYLLSEKNTLLQSDTLFFYSLDVSHSRIPNSDINFLADFECIGINVSQLHQMFALLPERYRPRSIQTVIRERISSMKPCECETVERLKEILTSNRFTNVLLRICKYDQSNLKRDLTTKDMQNIAFKLQRLRVHSVCDLATKLQLNGETVGTETNKICFYNDEEEVLYVDGNNIDIHRWLQIYSIELERCLRIIAQGQYHRHTLLCVLPSFSAKYDSIQETLNEYGIPSLEGDTADNIWFPRAGSLVPLYLKPFLRKAVHPLKIRSYVVIVANETLSRISIDVETILNQDITLVYGIITEIVTDSLGEIISYKLNVGEEGELKVEKDHLLEVQSRANESGYFENEETYVEPSFIRRDSTDSVDGRTFSQTSPTTYFLRLPNPQKGEGRVWLQQANIDLQTAYTLQDSLNRTQIHSYNWVCFLAQQAGEKAIKGAHYTVDANSVQRTHHLSNNVPKNDTTLRELAMGLQRVIGDINSLRYPRFRDIPSDNYSKHTAVEALQCANMIVQHVERTYF